MSGPGALGHVNRPSSSVSHTIATRRPVPLKTKLEANSIRDTEPASPAVEESDGFEIPRNVLHSQQKKLRVQLRHQRRSETWLELGPRKGTEKVPSWAAARAAKNVEVQPGKLSLTPEQKEANICKIAPRIWTHVTSIFATKTKEALGFGSAAPKTVEQALKFLTSLHTVYGKKVVPADTKWALMGVQKRIDVDLPKKSEEAAFLKYLEYYTSA